MKTGSELVAAGYSGGSALDKWPTHFIELQPDGSGSATIVWEWHMWDHLVQDFDNTKRIKRPEEILKERKLERERNNVWYRRWYRSIFG